jgi:hypothetical protein
VRRAGLPSELANGVEAGGSDGDQQCLTFSSMFPTTIHTAAENTTISVWTSF